LRQVDHIADLRSSLTEVEKDLVAQAAAGFDVVEVADFLGDTVLTVTQTYRQQLADAKRAAIRTEKMAATFASVLA
jgi:hypothetical protein